MTFLGTLLGAVAFAFLCKRPLKAYPWAFYALAIGLDVLFVMGSFGSWSVPKYDVLNALLHRCTLATALFVVVMFVGVFKREGRVAQCLRPVRAELSIFAWLLSLGHMVVYLGNYITRLSTGVAQTNVAVSLVVALALFVLLAVLGVTSFNVVKKRMSKDGWKRLQPWAYVFFGLVYVHLMLMLLPSALRGGEVAQISVAVYSVVFLAYAVARIARVVVDRKNATAPRSKTLPEEQANPVA